MNKLFDFNYDAIYVGMDIYTTYNGRLLILKNIYKYEGPVTLQYLPYGGIQTVFEGNLVINTKYGFVTCEYVIYDGIEMSVESFVKIYKNLVNQVLPN